MCLHLVLEFCSRFTIIFIFIIMHDLILFHDNDSVFIRSGNSFLSTGKKQFNSISVQSHHRYMDDALSNQQPRVRKLSGPDEPVILHINDTTQRASLLILT